MPRGRLCPLTYISRFSDQDQNGNSESAVMVPITIMFSSIYIDLIIVKAILFSSLSASDDVRNFISCNLNEQGANVRLCLVIVAQT